MTADTGVGRFHGVLDAVLAAVGDRPRDLEQVAARSGVRLTTAYWALRHLETTGEVSVCTSGSRRRYVRSSSGPVAGAA